MAPELVWLRDIGLPCSHLSILIKEGSISVLLWRILTRGVCPFKALLPKGEEVTAFSGKLGRRS
jgi:hypothetical protein